MLSTRQRITLSRWVSLIWLLAALLPTVSHAWMAQRAQSNVLNDLPSDVICSTSNGSTDTNTSGGAWGSSDHCGVCLPHAGATALPPSLLARTSVPPLLTQATPRLFLQAPRPLFAWATPALRGPPLA